MKRSAIFNGLLVVAIVGVFIWSFTLPSDSNGSGGPGTGADVDAATGAGDGAAGAAPPAHTLDEGMFWWVHVAGSESRAHLSGPESPPRDCPTEERFWFDDENETLVVRYGHDKDRIAGTHVVVSYDVAAEWSTCAVLHGITVRASAERELGRYGAFVYEVQGDGTLVAPEARTLGPGDTTRYEYRTEYRDGDAHYRVDGWLELTHRGVWSIDQVRVAE